MERLLGMMGLNSEEIQGQVENFIKKFNALLLVEQKNNMMLRMLCCKILTSEEVNNLWEEMEKKENEG
jgi:hypothetical protein